jgi:hypothetical protein
MLFSTILIVHTLIIMSGINIPGGISNDAMDLLVICRLMIYFFSYLLGLNIFTTSITNKPFISWIDGIIKYIKVIWYAAPTKNEG